MKNMKENDGGGNFRRWWKKVRWRRKGLEMTNMFLKGRNSLFPRIRDW